MLDDAAVDEQNPIVYLDSKNCNKELTSFFTPLYWSLCRTNVPTSLLAGYLKILIKGQRDPKRQDPRTCNIWAELVTLEQINLAWGRLISFSELPHSLLVRILFLFFFLTWVAVKDSSATNVACDTQERKEPGYRKNYNLKIEFYRLAKGKPASHCTIQPRMLLYTPDVWIFLGLHEVTFWTVLTF